MKTPTWNLISYCWRSSGINITTFLTSPRKITSRIKLRMRNPRKIYIRYSISQEICTRFLLCCALLWLYIDRFSHIHQAYFTGTVPAKQPWWIWINTSCEFIMNDCITTTKQSTTKPCAYFLGYTVCDKLLNREQRSVLPSHDCATSLANTFADYFRNKIELIRSNLEESLNTSTDQSLSTVPIYHGLSLEQFRVVSESDVRKVITSSPTKSCALDPIPTWLLKQCLDQVTPVLTVIVNTSLSCADFTPELKRVFVTPLIKKLIIDCEIFKNYRPVSNLSFVSKLIERIVCVQLVDHLKENDLYEIFQSAYRQLHSTETGLLRVQNDILQAVDSEGGAILILLDLSAAFLYHWPPETFGFIRLLLWN